MTNSSEHEFDIIIATDCRFPGGTSSSVAEEIKAQHAAGMKTALLHVEGPVIRRTKAFNRKLVECVLDEKTVLLPSDYSGSCKLLLLRHPAVFSDKSALNCSIKSERRLMIANQVPRDIDIDRQYYSVLDVDRVISQSFGGEFEWCPIGPLVRESLLEFEKDVVLSEVDWHNVINIDDWEVNRSRFSGKIPVIGRHGRDAVLKWPKKADLFKVYPTGEDFEVRILGGDKSIKEIAGRVPKNWTVYPFNSVKPKEFLKNIDFFVYFHSPSLIEAFGRTIIEAMASGAVVVLPQHFEELFGESALYCKEAEVIDLLNEYRNFEKYKQQSERALRFVRDNFSYEHHALRVSKLIGSNEGASSQNMHPVNPNILFVTSNGAGTGHLTRVMAIGSRLKKHTPVIFTLSQAIPVVESYGYAAEYLNSSGYLKTESNKWHLLLEDRLMHLIDVYQPTCIVFDGTHPYKGLLSAMKQHPNLKTVWSRRDMWRNDTSDMQKKQVFKAEKFDMVLSPGEWAAPADKGATKDLRKETTQVNPVTFLNRGDLVSKEESRQYLDLDKDKICVLLQLGAGNINDTQSVTGYITQVLLSYDNVQIFIPKTAIESSSKKHSEEIVHKSVYPLSRYLNGFDFSISASGYNTFHELVNFSIPSIFIPNTSTATDDQLSRGEYAAKMQAGITCLEEDKTSLAEAIGRMMKSSVREEMKTTLDELAMPNGAEDAAREIEKLVLGL